MPAESCSPQEIPPAISGVAQTASEEAETPFVFNDLTVKQY